MRSSKKAQIWYTDFMVALLIFVIMLIIYYEYLANISGEEKAVLEELVADSKSISSTLVSAGNPTSWTNSTVKSIGITDGNQRINQTKLDLFYNMSYNRAHGYFGTRFDYYIYFTNQSGDQISVTYGDYLGVAPLDQRNLAQMTRLLVYNSSIVKMHVQVWN